MAATKEPVWVSRPKLPKAATSLVLYVVILAGVSIHISRTPIYAMDFVQYMGNALLMEDSNPVRIHDRVYAELKRQVPASALDGLLGKPSGTPDDQNQSRRERANNASRYAQFLPLFAIRPFYNQTLWLLSKTGLGLVRAGILISTASYFLLGLLLFAWLKDYLTPISTVGISLLAMLTPPLVSLGREMTSDGFASLIAFSALYLILQKRSYFPGYTLLLLSIYCRTDFVVLAGPVILACWLERHLEFWKGAVLATVALSSVLAINHFAGDYGLKMLYYRNFTGVPVAPGEMVAHFGLHDYLSAFRSGITLVGSSFFFPFLLIGTLGLVARATRVLYAVTLAYVVVHFLVLPNWQERWVAVFYLTMVVCSGIAISARAMNNVEVAKSQWNLPNSERGVA